MTTVSEGLATRYAELKAEAEHLAGGSLDIPRRAALLHNLYRESGGNHVFPLIAAHGALWAVRYFEVGGTLGRLIGRRYFYNPREHAYRLGILERFADDFRAVNRCVFVDAHANFHFAREHGHEPEAGSVVPPDLLAALNRVHAASASGVALSEDEKEAVFRQSFHWEQEVTVAAGVKAAVETFDCPIMRRLCLMPVVRFAFFPRWRYLWFRNFSDKAERVGKGLRAFEHARDRGWAGVESSLRDYGLLPESYFLDPAAHCDELAGMAAEVAS